MSTATDATELSYDAAMAELQGHLAALERQQTSVDELVPRVARARELVTVCRERLTAARLQVTAVIDQPPAGNGPEVG